MGFFSGVSRLFQKGARATGNLFKKGARAVGSLARKGFYQGVEQLPRLGQTAGTELGTALGEAVAIGTGQPELIPEFGAFGARAGGQLGSLGGKALKSEIKKPVSRPKPVLGANPNTFTPRVDNRALIAKYSPLEKSRMMKEKRALQFK